MSDLPRRITPVPTGGVQAVAFSVGSRLVLVGVVAGLVLGAGVGARALIDDVAGMWFFGMLFGAGAVLGGVAAMASAAVVAPRAVVAAAQRPGPDSRLSLWWQLLVPIPVASASAWWVLQSPLVAPLDRVLVTAAAAAACAAWVMLTSAWVMAPLRGGDRRGSLVPRLCRTSS